MNEPLKKSQQHNLNIENQLLGAEIESNYDSETADEPSMSAKQVIEYQNGKKMSEEDIRLGGSPPLKTIVILSIGPLISQITGAMYGIINTVWISKAIGDNGLTAISTYNNFDTIGRAFAFFLQVASSAKISSLFGAGLKNEASQVFSDLLRLTIVCGIISPGVFLPITKLAARWFGASEDIVSLGYEFIFPNMMSTIVPCVYLLCCGCLQAEGRSWLFSIVQVSSLVSNMVIFAPFFLFACKSGIAGVAYSTICAELIPGVILTVLFYMGKFSIKPHPSDLLKKFSVHTWPAVKIGFSQLLYQLSLALPGLLIRKFFGVACGDDRTMWNDIMAGFNTFCRFWTLIMAVPTAMTIGFVPAGSFAFAAQRNYRFIRLLLHSSWIAITWTLFSMIFTVGIPRIICLAFSSTEGYLEWGEVIVRRATLCAFALPVSIIVTAVLQSQQKGNLATVLSFLTQLCPIPLFSTILFFTAKHDVARLMYCYPLSNVFSCLISLPFLYFAIRKLLKFSKEDKDAEQELQNIATKAKEEAKLAKDSENKKHQSDDEKEINLDDIKDDENQKGDSSSSPSSNSSSSKDADKKNKNKKNGHSNELPDGDEIPAEI
ncbi:MatE family protein [Tritrichomonas foetus]|uniref:MatE family protein n=1 Tax=Tritrichomonas foetus TaxID=1144522 RepID=A0A1J4JFA9_9EUKA|nr:MatE family protein [Tritrichomonas foetus]|eukprot:OHS97894.1 MatE family protein [Tritrichomonas foetus]